MESQGLEYLMKIIAFLNGVYELMKPDLKSLIWSVLTGIIVYYFSRWQNVTASLKEKVTHFNFQKKVTVAELRSNQRGNRGDEKHPFDIQQLSKLLSLEKVCTPIEI